MRSHVSRLIKFLVFYKQVFDLVTVGTYWECDVHAGICSARLYWERGKFVHALGVRSCRTQLQNCCLAIHCD